MGESPEKLYKTLFKWKERCENVRVSGSFINWGEGIPMEKQEDVFGRGVFWATEVDLPAGTHTFKFLVDGTWMYDPETAFMPDEYGNFNNFVNIRAYERCVPQEPIKTMLRDSKTGATVMNPEATAYAKQIRDGVYSNRENKSESTTSSSAEQDVEEYGLHVCRKSQSSDGILKSSCDAVLDKKVVEQSKPPESSVLLSARTQHFGGDLVTKEHAERQMSGGHKSHIATPSSHRLLRDAKLAIFLVGLPGRGKTYIGHTLCRHLTWMGHRTKMFNVGNYRREIAGCDVSHSFWDPENKESVSIRQEIMMTCLNDSLDALSKDDCDCIVFDATNVRKERRRFLKEETIKRGPHRIIFIESVANDPDILNSTVHEMKLNSDDYKNMTLQEAAEDYRLRIKHYIENYETMDASEGLSFIKVIDAGKQIVCNQIHGYLGAKLMFLTANLQFRPRPIWLCRHGESVFNTQKKIGGDSALSPYGMSFAEHLDRFVEAHYPSGTELQVWTSTMLRTGMTVKKLRERGRTIVMWKQLDEIDAGICDGMTYEQVAQDMPEEYLARTENKLHYRYPRGESYQDVIHRLESVITELVRAETPVLVVAHQAILRVLYSYLTSKNPEECPTISIPLHVVIQLTPRAYGCEETWHRPM